MIACFILFANKASYWGFFDWIFWGFLGQAPLIFLTMYPSNKQKKEVRNKKSPVDLIDGLFPFQLEPNQCFDIFGLHFIAEAPWLTESLCVRWKRGVKNTSRKIPQHWLKDFSPFACSRSSVENVFVIVLLFKPPSFSWLYTPVTHRRSRPGIQWAGARGWSWWWSTCSCAKWCSEWTWWGSRTTWRKSPADCKVENTPMRRCVSFLSLELLQAFL